MRRNKRRQMELGLVALAFSCIALLWLVLAIGFWQYANAESVITAAPTPQQTLPQKCQKYYNSGTDDWINCMGVGYR